MVYFRRRNYKSITKKCKKKLSILKKKSIRNSRVNRRKPYRRRNSRINRRKSYRRRNSKINRTKKLR